MSDGYCDNKLLYQKSYEALVKSTLDVQFIFENGDDIVKVPANRAVLAASSPVFNAMFNGELKEEGDVKITDASPEAFQEFLRFFYDPQVNLTLDNIAGVLKLVDKYDVADCLPLCSDFLKKNLKIGDILWALHLAVQFNLDDLKTFCEEEINENYKTVFEMIDFKGGRLQVSSDSRLSDAEMESILPHVFAVSKGIISSMSGKLDRLPVTLVSTNSTTVNAMTTNENIQFTLNETMLLTEMTRSRTYLLNKNMKSTIKRHLLGMSIEERPDSNDPDTKTLYTQNVSVGMGHQFKIKFEPPISIKHNHLYKISFKSDIPINLSVQKAIFIPNEPVELARGVNISFIAEEPACAYSLVSQLCFKST